jgi:hypothetical protein
MKHDYTLFWFVALVCGLVLLTMLAEWKGFPG